MATPIVDITMVRGDSADFIILVDDGGGDPLDLSIAVDATANRPAIIRFAVKKDPSKEKNTQGALIKLSYDASQIEVLPQTGLTVGRCIVKVDKPDTSDNKAGDYLHDLEITRQDALRPGASVGTLAIAAGNAVPIGTGTAITKAKVGDVVQITSGANIGLASLITKITSATSFETERLWENTDPSATFEIRRGLSKTAVAGKFTLVQDVVA